MIATTRDAESESMKVTDTSLRICPTSPLIMAIGKNTTIVVSPEPITEPMTSSVPLNMDSFTE